MVASRLGLVAGIALAAAIFAAAPCSAAEKATLLVDLTTDDVWTNQMGLGIVRKYVDTTGGPAAVFLNVRAVVLANRKVPQHTGALAQKDFHSLLRELMAKGVRVYVCGECTKQAGLSIDDRLDGTEIGGTALLELLADPKTNVLSY
jgi:predicted peroxiredoxin